MVTCQSSELDWEVTVELPADFLSLGRGSVMPGARQDLTPPVRALNINHKPLALPTIGFGHTGTSASWEGLV